MVIGHDTSDGIRTDDIKISENVTFDTMLLSPLTLKGLKSAGFYKPSPVQLHGIPLGKCGFDLLLEAKSGTGKTGVFSVIALEKLDLDKGLQAIMLAPTREIAAQILDVIKVIGSEHKGLNIEVVMGGLPLQDDINKFSVKNKVHIVVGSPGRLRHMIEDKYINMSSVRLVVLDEADKLMEKSFQSDIKYIFSRLPNQKQVIMSSATFPENLKPFIEKYIKNAQHICPDSTSILLGIEQKVSIVNNHSNILRQTKYRYEELLKLLTSKQFKQCLIFCNYQTRVSELHKLLKKDKWPSDQLYGSQEQTERLNALKTLQQYKCRILISTDLAARGIDASNIDLVINFEPAYDWQTYLHRIGRAGRYGSYGCAVSIVAKGVEEKKFKKVLENIHDKLNIKYLWSGEQYVIANNFEALSDNEKSLTSDNEEILSIVKELDNGLCKSDDMKCMKVESFNELCESFEKSDEVESFDDLLKSFENDLDKTHKEVKFKTFERTCLDNEINKIIKEHNISITLDSNNIIKQKCDKSDNSKSSVHNDNNTLHNVIDTINENDEFAMLGLPSAFGKQSKKKQQTAYCSKSTELCDGENRKKEYYKNSKHKEVDNSVATTYNNKPRTFKKRHSVDKSDRNKCDYVSYSEELNKYKCENTKDKSCYRPSQEKLHLRNSNDLNGCSSYNQWYNLLKMRTKQIELALYIEEMTRI